MKLTGAKGTEVTTYTYGTYGELLSGDTTLTRFLYNGRCGVTTDDNGLYYMRQRYYNPEIKRFVNQDILTGSLDNSQSLNRYSYVQGNPVSYTDPFGLSPINGLFSGTDGAHLILGLLGCIPGVGFVFDIADAAIYAFVDHDYGMAALSMMSVVLDCAPMAVSALLAGKTVANSADLLKAGNRVANLTQSARVADMTSEMANAYKGLDRINDAGSAMKSVTKYTVDNLDTLAKKGAKEVYAEVTTGAYKAGREALQESMEETFEAAWKGSKNVTPSDFAGGACFVAGTKIKTIDGYQNIEDIEEGDLVSAWNEETGETGYKEVIELFRNEVTELTHVQIGDNTIITTPTHPFWVEGYGFKAAGELKAGDKVQTAEGEILTVTGIEKEYLDNPIIVYNFEVADWHTYYVSEDEVLVHNMCMVDVKNGRISNEIILSKEATHDAARNTLLKEIDKTGAFKNGSNKYIGRLESSYGYGKQIGRQSFDGKVRWRLDYDEEIGVHYNFEDFSNGKGVNAIKKIIPIDISYDEYIQILDLWN